MRHWIPKHLGGMVGVRLIGLIGTAYFLAGAQASLAVAVLLIANFVDDQIVHLSQENHKDAELSRVELALMRAPWLFRTFAWIFALVSVAILCGY